MQLCDSENSWARLLVEKPFGTDIHTAQDLEDKLCSQYEETQVFRIDHYLAKDAIENIFSLRFANGIISDVWNNEHVESIHIDLCEEKDVANRGSFYDDIGALRDVGSNHMMQILALMTMNPADIHDTEEIRSGRSHIIRGDVYFSLRAWFTIVLTIVRARRN